MRIMAGALFISGMMAMATFTAAQPPGGKGDKGGKGDSKTMSVDELVAVMMAFDKNKDGKLTKDEITDERLHRLFDRADANKDGVVTKEELTALFTKELAAMGSDGPGGPGGKGGFPGGPGGKGGFPGGPGGPGGFGPPQPGQLMPPFVQEMLKLTDDQKKQLDAMQKDVDAKLEKLLTDDQRKQLKEMRERGPGGFGPGGPPPKKQ
jgi:hypothetical protein